MDPHVLLVFPLVTLVPLLLPVQHVLPPRYLELVIYVNYVIFGNQIVVPVLILQYALLAIMVSIRTDHLVLLVFPPV